MKIILSIISVLVISISSAVAQKWIPAYIITSRGDTSHGEIKFNKKQIYNQVVFKTEEGGVREFYPEQLRGYSFANRYFTRDEKVGNLVFIEKKVDGPVSLYKTNLLVKVAGTVPPATYKVNYFVRRDIGDYVPVTKKDFKEKMPEFFKDHKEIHDQIKNNKLKYKDIAEIINQYNSWYTSNNR
ncbi:MAG: hypothetical protein ACR2GN_04810 [Bacteroidia bacterium]